jgi:hypothetical protein
MNPAFMQFIATEHVNDMRAEATLARRARAARRARRGWTRLAARTADPCPA